MFCGRANDHPLFVPIRVICVRLARIASLKRLILQWVARRGGLRFMKCVQLMDKREYFTFRCISRPSKTFLDVRPRAVFISNVEISTSCVPPFVKKPSGTTERCNLA